MFVELDVVEFQDSEVPFTTILLNTAFVRQVQRIDNGIQSNYMTGRAKYAEDHKIDPIENHRPPSPVTELPSGGAMIAMLYPHLGTYYTVTPYQEVKNKFLELGRETNISGSVAIEQKITRRHDGN